MMELKIQNLTSAERDHIRELIKTYKDLFLIYSEQNSSKIPQIEIDQNKELKTKIEIFRQ